MAAPLLLAGRTFFDENTYFCEIPALGFITHDDAGPREAELAAEQMVNHYFELIAQTPGKLDTVLRRLGVQPVESGGCHNEIHFVFTDASASTVDKLGD